MGEFVTHDPNQKFDRAMRKEIRMLPAIADMGMRGHVDLCIHLETSLEL